MTKAERIRKLAEQQPEWSTKQIAAKCDCLPSYVRTVLRQRVEGCASEHDRRYLKKFVEQHGWPNTIRYRSDPEFRDRRKTYQRDYYARKKAEREASAPA